MIKYCKDAQKINMRLAEIRYHRGYEEVFEVKPIYQIFFCGKNWKVINDFQQNLTVEWEYGLLSRVFDKEEES